MPKTQGKDKAKMRGNRDALLVATSQFNNPGLQKLRSPARDVESLAEVLSNPEIGDFSVTKVVDNDHNHAMRSIETFFSDRNRDDLLLLHVSTHGLKADHGDLYFAARNTERNLLESTGIPAAFLRSQMTRCRAKSIVLLLDCCYSGAFLPGTKGDSTVHLKDELSGHGRAILTATNRTEYAWEGSNLSELEPEPSTFTGAIIEGLRSGDADRDRDGKISVQELYDYVYDSVRSKNSLQSPQFWSEIEYQVVVARSPFGSSTAEANKEVESAVTLEPSIKEPEEDPQDSLVNLDNPLRDVEVAQLKRALPDPVRRIEVFDLIDQSVTDAVKNSNPDARPTSGPFFKDNIRGYRRDCDTLLHLLAVGVFHDQGLHDSLWTRAIERLGQIRNHPLQSFRDDLEHLRLYPALLAASTIGVAAVLGGREEVIGRTLTVTKFREPFGRRSRLNAAIALNPLRVIMGPEINEICQPGNGQKYYYPQSHYLREELREPFASLEPDEAAYNSAFHRFEFLASMISMDPENSSVAAPWSGEFLLDSTWGYDNSGLAGEIEQEIGSSWPLLLGGAFGGDVERAEKAYAALVEFKSRAHHW